MSWSHRLPAPVVPLDGQPIERLRDIVEYMDGIGERRQAGRAWHRRADSLLKAAERGGSTNAVDRQLRLAMILDGKLDVVRAAVRMTYHGAT